MTDTQHYERIKDLYDRLDGEGKKKVREMYPECFTIVLPKTIEEVYNHCGGLTTLRRNVPVNAAQRLSAFADLLCLESALNNGAAGTIACSINVGDCAPTAFHPVRCDQNPSYRLPIFLDQERMNYALETFPELFNKLLCSKQS